MLYEYFTNGTGSTKTGGMIGMEVETDFLRADGRPISTAVTAAILRETDGRPSWCAQKLELGVQKIEVSIAPQPTAALAIEATQEGLHWLYGVAARFDAAPVFAPEFPWQGDLLWVQEERDALWVDLDGRAALEHLCRCSSVQFTVDINPHDAITVINRLWQARLHERDYAVNHARWRAYIRESAARYRADRYAGPAGFVDMEDYVRQLIRQEVVMHRGQPVRLSADSVIDLNTDLYLRSVWWHYRLRRFGSSLAVEIRPIARRRDEDFAAQWKWVEEAVGL